MKKSILKLNVILCMIMLMVGTGAWGQIVPVTYKRPADLISQENFQYFKEKTLSKLNAIDFQNPNQQFISIDPINFKAELKGNLIDKKISLKKRSFFRAVQTETNKNYGLIYSGYFNSKEKLTKLFKNNESSGDFGGSIGLVFANNFRFRYDSAVRDKLADEIQKLKKKFDTKINCVKSVAPTPIYPCIEILNDSFIEMRNHYQSKYKKIVKELEEEALKVSRIRIWWWTTTYNFNFIEFDEFFKEGKIIDKSYFKNQKAFTNSLKTSVNLFSKIGFSNVSLDFGTLNNFNDGKKLLVDLETLVDGQSSPAANVKSKESKDMYFFEKGYKTKYFSSLGITWMPTYRTSSTFGMGFTGNYKIEEGGKTSFKLGSFIVFPVINKESNKPTNLSIGFNFTDLINNVTESEISKGIENKSQRNELTLKLGLPF